MITPGQAGDSPMFLPLMSHLRVGREIGRPRTRPGAVRGDKAYSSRAIRSHLRDRGIKAVTPEPDDQKGHRKRRGSRGGRPVALDTIEYNNRNVIERRFCHLKHGAALPPDTTTRRHLPCSSRPPRDHRLDPAVVTCR